MTRYKERRARVFSLVAVALGAVAIFALPSLASARHGSDDNGTASATVKSFDQATRTLVVALPGDQTVSGTVDSRTKIRCEDQGDHRRGDHRVRGREAEPGDDHGGHGNEAGDDNGGHGVEPGDDNGGHGVEPGDDNGGHGVEPGDDNGGHGVEPGDDNGGDNPAPSNSGPGANGHDDNGLGASCTSADLVPGAAVEKIELKFRGGGVVYDEVELSR